jgi:hypothetical protein
MKLINVRSPYFITVNEVAQLGSKIELYIWKNGDSVPATPNYTLSKKIASPTQLENNYNVSNFAKEFINNISTTLVATPTSESNTNWVNLRVKRYSLNTSYTLLDTIDYVCVNGYNEYVDGYNKLNTNLKIVSLTDQTKAITYERETGIPYINIFVDSTLGDKLELNYTDARGRNLTNIIVIATTDSDTKNMFKIPISTTNIKYDEYNNLEIKYTSGATIYSFDYRVTAICENKYTPILCSFINKNGGWEFLTFFKAQTNNVQVKGNDYKLNQSSVNYNPLIGQNKSLNINGQQSIKLNTGWVDENYSSTIKELLLSETILLDNKPVQVKTQTSDLKTSLKDMIINYEIEFIYSYNLLNDVV